MYYARALNAVQRYNKIIKRVLLETQSTLTFQTKFQSAKHLYFELNLAIVLHMNQNDILD